MNKMYEIEYYSHTTEPSYREVVTVDGRSTRENRTPTSLIAYADRMARNYWKAYKYEVSLYKPPHITASGVQIGVAHLIYTGTVDE